MPDNIASVARRVAEDIRIGRHSLPDDLDAIKPLLDAVAAGPGDDRVERVARALCVASGHADPDEPYADASMWRRWEAKVRFVLALADAEAAARAAEGWAAYEEAKARLGGQAVLSGLLIEAEDFAALDAAALRLTGLPAA